MVRTKIVCTLGPASSETKVLRKMINAGMDVARLNFSHGDHLGHQVFIDRVREINKKNKRAIKILQDLEGYRIRIGKFFGKDTIELRKGQSIIFTNVKKNAKKDVIFFDYEGDLGDIENGNCIFIDDGNISLKVKGHSGKYLRTEVIMGGILRENKGINIPEAKLKFPCFTQKDEKDLYFGMKNNVEMIAQSFVRNKNDIMQIRKIIDDNKFKCKLIAKIENKDGINNIDEILEVSDGIMIARGDLGVSIPIYKIPIVQKKLIKKCIEKKKFVITATQMLESMTDNIRPTRAETTDVANSIIDGTNYTMLSGETAVGKYPAETVDMMNKIIKYTENYLKTKNN